MCDLEDLLVLNMTICKAAPLYSVDSKISVQVATAPAASHHNGSPHPPQCCDKPGALASRNGDMNLAVIKGR